MASVETFCKNRNVVNVDERLYSPFYDSNGKDGLHWHESLFAPFRAEDFVMCYWSICDYESYNGWAKATNDYITLKLLPFYKKVLNRANIKYDGAPLPQPLRDSFNKVEELAESWNASGIKPDKTRSDVFSHPLSTYWSGEIKSIIRYFDSAACEYDGLNALSREIGSPELAKKVPGSAVVPSPTGSYFDGSGGPSPSPVSTSSVLGFVALGGAAYFGFKVLTE